MEKIFYIVSLSLTLGALYSMAHDVFSWAVTDQVGSAGESFVTRVLDIVLSLPLKVLTVLVNLVLSVLEGVLNSVFKLIGMDKGPFQFQPIDMTK